MRELKVYYPDDLTGMIIKSIKGVTITTTTTVDKEVLDKGYVGLKGETENDSRND